MGVLNALSGCWIMSYPNNNYKEGDPNMFDETFLRTNEIDEYVLNLRSQ